MKYILIKTFIFMAKMLVYFVNVYGLTREQANASLEEYEKNTHIDDVMQSYIGINDDKNIIEDVMMFDIDEKSLIIMYVKVNGLTREQSDNLLSESKAHIEKCVSKYLKGCTVQVLPTYSEYKIRVLQLGDKVGMICS